MSSSNGFGRSADLNVQFVTQPPPGGFSPPPPSPPPPPPVPRPGRPKLVSGPVMTGSSQAVFVVSLVANADTYAPTCTALPGSAIKGVFSATALTLTVSSLSPHKAYT